MHYPNNPQILDIAETLRNFTPEQIALPPVAYAGHEHQRSVQESLLESRGFANIEESSLYFDKEDFEPLDDRSSVRASKSSDGPDSVRAQAPRHNDNYTDMCPSIFLSSLFLSSLIDEFLCA